MCGEDDGSSHGFVGSGLAGGKGFSRTPCSTFWKSTASSSVDSTSTACRWPQTCASLNITVTESAVEGHQRPCPECAVGWSRGRESTVHEQWLILNLVRLNFPSSNGSGSLNVCCPDWFYVLSWIFRCLTVCLHVQFSAGRSCFFFMDQDYRRDIQNGAP
uniref:Uncharacterized protein n=1 Tax=Oryza punctata TaxID=4537 RepID=A0A0E0JH75_ORYPU